ncbi:MarR family winged helix-turn-helix transcriptional regulator [Chloroflexota bacterium]
MEEKIFEKEDESYALWLLLIQTNKAIHLARQEELSRIGITVAEAGILYYAGRLGKKATPAEISRRLSKVSHGISALITRMETQGLVKKVKDLDKKNLVRVELTEKGRQIHQDAVKRETIRRIMSSLSVEDSKKLTSCLKKLRKVSFGNITLRKRLVYLGYEE